MGVKPTTLLMFSGGLDSTGALWELAQQKTPLLVHHMHLSNVENRLQAEKVAVERILEYTRQFTTIQYTESTHEYLEKRFIWDGEIASFMAGTICHASPWVKHVAMGRTASDDTNPGSVARAERANKIFQVMCQAVKIYPVQHLTKREIYDGIPEDLRNLFWSCRKPRYEGSAALPCNKCITCRHMKEIGVMPRIQSSHNQLWPPST